MRKTMMALIAAATTLTAVPATAQYYGGQRYNYDQRGGRDIDMRLRNISQRIETGYRRGAITNGEARSLQREVQYVAQLDRRYGYNGYSRGELNTLQNRLDRLSQRVRFERRDGDRAYNDRYGYRR